MSSSAPPRAAQDCRDHLLGLVRVTASSISSAGLPREVRPPKVPYGIALLLADFRLASFPKMPLRVSPMPPPPGKRR